uniref:Type II toxin-antitoxin system HipA family toxin n=1 Tax=Mesocestoides corti TaxID=53468 RepID=A0A5K3FJ67_MESCO
MFVLGEHGQEGEVRQPPAFVELDELCFDPGSGATPEWREVARQALNFFPRKSTHLP